MSSLAELGIDRLSVEERLALADAIWDSVAAEAEAAPLTAAQRQEIERRLAAHSPNQQPAIPWERVEAGELARLIRAHDLNSDEIVRLVRVLWDYPPEAQQAELQEELRCVLAARDLAKRPKLTNETVDKAREAFASGRVPFVPQEMD
jgi:putative addiction module component (TIGR02574 family)